MPSSSLAHIFVASESLEDFFQGLDVFLRTTNPKFNYAWLAQRAGISSRSYVRSVFLGLKKPSTVTIRKLAKALKFSHELEEGLTLLAELKISNGEDKKAHVLSSLKKVQQKLNRQTYRKLDHKTEGSLFKIRSWPYIFASLGDPKKGSTLPEISKRSNIENSACLKILDEMIKMNVVRLAPANDAVENRYFAEVDFLDFSKLGNDKYFCDFYELVVKRLSLSLRKGFSDPQKLFNCAVVSVNRKDLPTLAIQLQKVLSEFATHIEDPNGDTIITIQTALF